MERKADTHIRVTEETWAALNAKKRPGDSFDDVIQRLLSDADSSEPAGETGPSADFPEDDLVDHLKALSVDQESPEYGRLPYIIGEYNFEDVPPPHLDLYLAILREAESFVEHIDGVSRADIEDELERVIEAHPENEVPSSSATDTGSTKQSF